jgi:hypothetical protein
VRVGGSCLVKQSTFEVLEPFAEACFQQNGETLAAHAAKDWGVLEELESGEGGCDAVGQPAEP